MRTAYQVVASDQSPVEVVSPQVFADALDQMRDHPKSGYLSYYPVSKILSEGMIPVLENGAGCLVWDHRDGRIEAVSLFSTNPGAGIALLKEVITQYHVNYVECYAPLHGLYEQLGFHDTEKYDFDPTLTEDNWDTALGTPDYHIMMRRPPISGMRA